MRCELQANHDRNEATQRVNGSRLGVLRPGVERARPDDLPSIRRLLDLAGLPYADVSEESLKDFLVYRTSAGIVGTVGLEYHGDAVLLRSLVVEKQHVGRGIGKQLVVEAETLSSDAAVSAIYLLTTTADRFFEALGFRQLHRHLAPETIRGCQQFTSLCPGSAVLMVKP